MLLYEKGKYAGVVVGVTMAVFLMLLQAGFYFGFRRDITVVSDSFDADLWFSPRPLLASDYAIHMDDLPVTNALADGDVFAAMGVIIEWSRMRSLSGAAENGQVVGVDLSSGVKVNLG